jgi:CRP-like cAMP-binding protein
MASTAGPSVKETLRRCELLDPLSGRQIEALAGRAVVRSLGEGESLFRKDEESRQLFVVQSGQLSVHLASPDGGDIGWAVSGPYCLLGWSAFFTPSVYVADARAVQDGTEVVAIDAGEAEEIMLRDPVAAYDVMKRIAGEISMRLRDLREQFVEMATAK